VPDWDEHLVNLIGDPVERREQNRNQTTRHLRRAGGEARSGAAPAQRPEHAYTAAWTSLSAFQTGSVGRARPGIDDSAKIVAAHSSAGTHGRTLLIVPPLPADVISYMYVF
jgi:hypothetical protein